MKDDDLQRLREDLQPGEKPGEIPGLDLLVREAGRKRRRRQLSMAMGCLLAVAMFYGWMTWSSPSHSRPAQVANQTPDEAMISIEVEWISEAELLAQLGDQPLMIIGEGDQRELILIEP